METPLIAAKSEIAYWKYRLVPEGMPAGQEKGKLSAPVTSVSSESDPTKGNGTRKPPLKGVGLFTRPVNRTAVVAGRADVRSSVVGEPETSVPVPARTGTPSRPGRPKPSCDQPEPESLVKGTGSEAMPLATTSSM